MKLPICMLRDYVSTSLSAGEIGDLLTMAGFELEELTEVDGEHVLNVKVMANRGDGLSAYGLAREVLAKDKESKSTELYERATARFSCLDDAKKIITPFGYEFCLKNNSDNCPHVALRFVDDAFNGDSPAWLQQRLHWAGVRAISLLVDLTNYVMLDVGQPLHAFDFDKVHDATFVIRDARQGEKMVTLNNQEHTFLGGELIIEDANRIIDLCGIMGGLNTEVDGTTRRLLLQGAHFRSESVRKTRKQLNIASEASYRFERYVDPNGVLAGLNRYMSIYCAIRLDEPDAWLASEFSPNSCGVLEGVLQDRKADTGAREPIVVRPKRIEQLLGMTVNKSEQIRHLADLGFSIEDSSDLMKVTPPSWRADVSREEDVAEEVGRVHGYDKIPESAPRVSTIQGGVFGLPRVKDIVREAMLRCGFSQIMSHTLLDRHPLEFTSRKAAVRTPHSPELAFLRDSLLPGLCAAAQRNGGKDLHLFEIGNVFVQGEIQIDESPELAILSTGKLDSPFWVADQQAEADFFSMKGILEAVSKAIGINVHIDTPRILDPRFHPTRQAGLLVDDGVLWVGYFGQIHPDKAEELDLPATTVLAEMDLLVLASEHEDERHLKHLSRNPAIRRDIAVLISQSVPYSEIERAIVTAADDLLESHWLFDVYKGKGVPDGDHSLAIALLFRRMGENLTDEEANEARDRVVRAIGSLGGRLR